MSHTASHDDGPVSDEVPLFSPVEVEQFSADDVTAGGAIGKMLSALFLYTVVAMGISGWWTYASINADKATAADSHSGEHVDEHDHSEASENKAAH